MLLVRTILIFVAADVAVAIFFWPPRVTPTTEPKAPSWNLLSAGEHDFSILDTVVISGEVLDEGFPDINGIKSTYSNLKTVICTINIGTTNVFDPLNDAYNNAGVILSPTGGPDNEAFLDIRVNAETGEFPVYEAAVDSGLNRFEAANKTGCDGVLMVASESYLGVDGIDGFDALRWISFLSNEASSYGMLFGVVDSATLAVCLEQYADFVLVQQCLEFDDCNLWKPYVDEEKPVYSIEYVDDLASLTIAEKREICCITSDNDIRDSFQIIIKQQGLDDDVIQCGDIEC